MGSVVLLFVVTLTVIMFASYREIRQQNSEMLERYVEIYSLDQQPGSQNGPESGPGNQGLPTMARSLLLTMGSGIFTKRMN